MIMNRNTMDLTPASAAEFSPRHTYTITAPDGRKWYGAHPYTRRRLKNGMVRVFFAFQHRDHPVRDADAVR